MAVDRVLIVDDEHGIARLCQHFLESASFKAVITSDSKAGLDLIQHQKFDLLLTDIQMPDVDGFQLLEAARQHQPEMAVLFMTAFGTVETAIRALRYGADGLILKPFGKGSELIEASRQALHDKKQKRDAARLQALRPLFDISETLIFETNLQALVQLILDAVNNLFQVDYASIFQKKNGDSEWDLLGKKGELTGWDEAGIEKDMINRVMKDRTPVLVNRNGTGNPKLQALLEKTDTSTAMITTINRNQDWFAITVARGLDGPAFSESDAEMLVILARQAVVAMENANLYSDLRSYVRKIEVSQRALIQAEKMAALGRVMASVAHEVSNPLQSVQNCLHLANHPGVSPEKKAYYFELAQSELERLGKTVRQMLDYYRPAGSDKVQTSIEQLVDRVLKLLQPQLDQRGIQIIRSYETPEHIILGVPDQLQQVFFNLILNAYDAMEKTDSQRRLWVEIYSDDDQAHIRVEDNGPGIAEGMDQVIFEPFISTKQSGTGLGLAISFGIIQAHGGTLRIAEPHHGNGACFEVSLPAGIQ
jgi:two-component system, NtrC family, sensor kinase